MKNAVIFETGKPKDGELELINSMTRRPFSEEELYVFSVTLCDNDIDRDFERFTVGALNDLAEMYVGKSGIFDHSMRGKDQIARIFSCKVENREGTFTKDGRPYSCLTARAYMPRTEKNAELIVDIDAGINKEVSVGCSMESAVCSVCGTDRHIGCPHKNGRHYKKDGKKMLCHTILDKPRDAFEWSFVAVPAQPKAGVTKSFAAKFTEPQTNDSVALVAKMLGIKAESEEEMSASIRRIKGLAQKGQEYLDTLKSRTLGEISQLCGGDTAKSLSNALEAMDFSELEAFCQSLHKQMLEKSISRPQTAPKINDDKKGNNNFNFIV